MSQRRSVTADIQAVLGKHFPDACGDGFIKCSNRIARMHLLGKRFQDLERSRKRPSADIAGLHKMLHHIQKADALRAKIGFSGGAAINEVLFEASPKTLARIGGSEGPLDALETVERHFANLIQLLESAIGRIDTDDAPQSASPSRSSWRGRPAELSAFHTARECAKAYRALTGEQPTVPTEAMSGKAYGPFLALVTDIFAALGIKSSAEAMARKVTAKEKNGPN